MVSHQHLADVHVRRDHDSTSRSLGCLGLSAATIRGAVVDRSAMRTSVGGGLSVVVVLCDTGSVRSRRSRRRASARASLREGRGRGGGGTPPASPAAHPPLLDRCSRAPKLARSARTASPPRERFLAEELPVDVERERVRATVVRVACVRPGSDDLGAQAAVVRGGRLLERDAKLGETYRSRCATLVAITGAYRRLERGSPMAVPLHDARETTAMVSRFVTQGAGRGHREGGQMRKLIAGAAIAGLVMMGGGNAFAGEVTGNGKPTPVANPGSGGRFRGRIDLCLQRAGRRLRNRQPRDAGCRAVVRVHRGRDGPGGRWGGVVRPHDPRRGSWHQLPRLRQRWRRGVALGHPQHPKGRSQGSGPSPLMLVEEGLHVLAGHMFRGDRGQGDRACRAAAARGRGVSGASPY